MTPALSIIVPVFNRGELIRCTLESVRRASAGLQVEVIVVDDGSAPPATEAISRLGFEPTKILRQENRGLLFARLPGFAAATGRYTLFLDSDDLVAPEKLRAQTVAMDASGADVSYTDMAHCELAGDYESLVITPDPPTRTTTDAADFFINSQPAPHSPVFRTSYLRKIVEHAFIPPSSLYNSVAEIWFYHNAAPHPAQIQHVPGPLTIGCTHPGARLTNHWEKLGVASLAVMEAFARLCPDTPAAGTARQYVAEKAFGAWRRLPRGFSPEFDARLLDVWRALSRVRNLQRLGGRGFQTLGHLFGAESAGRMLRRIQNGSYESCRTLPDTEVAALIAHLRSPRVD